MHSVALNLSSLEKKGTRTQLPHSDASHSKRSWCQSQTLKHCLWLSGFSMWWQWEWWVVQPSMWMHHIVLVWTPPEPHSSPVHWPHWPAAKKKHTERAFSLKTEALGEKWFKLQQSGSLQSSKIQGHSLNLHDCFIHELRKKGTKEHKVIKPVADINIKKIQDQFLCHKGLNSFLGSWAQTDQYFWSCIVWLGVHLGIMIRYAINLNYAGRYYHYYNLYYYFITTKPLL